MPLAFSESGTLKLHCNSAPVMDSDVFSSARAFADSLSFQTFASTGRLAPEHFTPESHAPDLENSRIRQGFELKFSASFFLEVASLSNRLGYPTGISKSIGLSFFHMDIHSSLNKRLHRLAKSVWDQCSV